MAITYNVTIDQAEIELAIENHIKKVMNLSGDIKITITNSNRGVANLAAAIDVNPVAPKVEAPVYRTPEPTKAIIVEQPVVIPEVPEVVSMAQGVVHTPAVVEQKSEAEMILAPAAEQVTLGGMLDFTTV